jgi:hypothetical protein
MSTKVRKYGHGYRELRASSGVNQVNEDEQTNYRTGIGEVLEKCLKHAVTTLSLIPRLMPFKSYSEYTNKNTERVTASRTLLATLLTPVRS